VDKHSYYVFSGGAELVISMFYFFLATPKSEKRGMSHCPKLAVATSAKIPDCGVTSLPDSGCIGWK